MLASRGAVYHTRKTAGEFRHFHRRCDCKVVPGFEVDPDAELVEGVRPEELRDQWAACKRADEEVSAPGLTKEAVKRQLLTDPAASLDAPLEKSVPWLRAVDSYLVPDAKLNAYALSRTGNKDKTEAFRSALGFTPSDAPEVIRQLYEWLADNPPAAKGEDGHGERFESRLVMAGRNGRKANVVAGWILRPGQSIMQLTTILVKKK